MFIFQGWKLELVVQSAVSVWSIWFNFMIRQRIDVAVERSLTGRLLSLSVNAAKKTAKSFKVAIDTSFERLCCGLSLFENSIFHFIRVQVCCTDSAGFSSAFLTLGGQNQFSFHAASVEKRLHLRWHHLTVGLKAWLAVFTLQTIHLRQVNNDFHSVWWKNTAFGNERTLAVKNL